MNGLSSTWSWSPAVSIGLAVAVLAYWRGARRVVHALDGRARVTARRLRALSFYAGIGVVCVALQSPVDTMSDQVFWSHMLQHLLLIMVAAPLLVLGGPLTPMLRGLPLGARRTVLGFAANRKWTRGLGGVILFALRPGPVLVIFVADLYAWHWNFLFAATLQHPVVHIFEHCCFLATAVVFWGQLIEQRGVRVRLSLPQRILYCITAAGVSNILSMYFVFSPHADYPYYAAVTHRPFRISALADQQFAGALMWVPVLFIFGGAAVICFVLWLREQDAMDSRPVQRTRSPGVVLASSNQRMHPVIEAVHPYNERSIVERDK